jgi:catalase-peroxidase
MGEAFNYAEEFKKLDLEALKKDLYALMTDSQEWWPADYGHYGGSSSAWPGTAQAPTAWATAAGVGDRQPALCTPQQLARQREPRQGAPSALADQAEIRPENLLGRSDDPRRQLRPRVDGLQDLRFRRRARGHLGAGGGHLLGFREEWLATSDKRYRYRRPGSRESLAAVQMGLIYVNPEGPDGNPDPVASGRDVRETFARMAMNDEETVALVAGGHTFGKCHGAGDAALVGPEPEAAGIEEQGLGWKSSFGSGKGGDTISSGIEGAWKPNPTKWDMGYLKVLFKYEWELVKSPAGANQWLAKDVDEEDMVVDAHDPSKKHRPMMTTADLSLRFDPIYEPIARRYLENPEEFADAFARAWFKLTHRDMGPRSRYLGPEVPAEELIWQDPVPAVDHELIDESGHRRPQGQDPCLGPVGLPTGLDRLGVGLHVPRLRHARRGQRGAHPSCAAEGLGSQPAGAACRLCWRPSRESKRRSTAHSPAGRRFRWPTLIVLGGCAGVEQAAKNAGHDVTVPFTPGRTDASQEQTDVGVIRRTRTGCRRVPQLPQNQIQPYRQRNCWLIGRNC